MNFLNKFCNVLEFIFVNLFHTGSAIPNYIMTSPTNVEKGKPYYLAQLITNLHQNCPTTSQNLNYR